MALIFRQLFDPKSSTYTYLLACAKSREAILIDSVFEQASRDAAQIAELGLRLTHTVETHIHADHVTGASLLKQRLGSRITVPAESGASGADMPIRHGDRIRFGEFYVEARATPGHTAESLSYVLGDESMAFTGDALLIRGCGRTDFQHGSAAALYGSVHTQLFTLPDFCLIYPGHDYRGLTVTSVAEEKRFNPRLGGAISEKDFSGYMQNLRLPHPKQIDIAVPANMKSGQSDQPSDAPDWAPLTFTFAGIYEIPPGWVEDNPGAALLIDVREPEEFTGPLGHIDGAILIPLGQLADRAGQIGKDKPVVCVCRSGARSAQATNILMQSGFTKVANMTGGMLRWRSEGLPVEGGAS